ncbi:MAG: motility associated factor glycosyltransferase family protein [Spirochaetia bacterium]
MCVFDRNIQALCTRYPQVQWKQTLSNLCQSLPTGITITPSRTREIPTMTSFDQGVHSSYNPIAEAQKILAGIPDDCESYTLIGLGLGYLALEFIQTRPQKVLILIEPDIPLFAQLLLHIDFTSVIMHKEAHFFFSNDKNDLLQFLRKLNVYSGRIIANRVLSLRLPQIYETLHKEIHLYFLRKSVNFKTIQEQGELWIRSLCCNLEHFATTPGISQLKNKFEGFPALLIAAGPSLDTLWPHVKAVQSRCVLICVDTALRVLLQHDIHPDFVISVDSQYWNSRHLDNCYSPHTVFIADPSLYPSILRKKERFHFFLTSSLFPIGRYLEQETEQKGELVSGGSVSTSAFDFARQIGISELWMIGLDLAFPDGKTHAHGARFEQWAIDDGTRLAPAENFFVVQSYGTYPQYYEGNKRPQVLTDKRMEVYRLWFEDQAHSLRCFNLSDGVSIANIPAGNWQHIMQLPIQRTAIDKKMAQIHTIEIATDILQEKLNQAIKKIQKDLTQMQELCHQGEKETQNLLRRFAKKQDINMCIKKLETIDTQLAQSQSKEALAFLLEPFFQQFQVSQREAKNPIDSIKKSCQLYRELATSARFYEELFKNSSSS